VRRAGVQHLPGVEHDLETDHGVVKVIDTSVLHRLLFLLLLVERRQEPPKILIYSFCTGFCLLKTRS
jgi:hypothetical protein